jgi:hypothetical protein
LTTPDLILPAARRTTNWRATAIPHVIAALIPAIVAMWTASSATHRRSSHHLHWHGFLNWRNCNFSSINVPAIHSLHGGLSVFGYCVFNETKSTTDVGMETILRIIDVLYLPIIAEDLNDVILCDIL